MKKLLLSASVTAILSPSVLHADPAFMFGLGLSFGGGQSPELALTGKILSDNEEDKFAGSLGLNFYPGSGRFGVDAGVAYLLDGTAVSLSYDFFNNAPMFGVGGANTESAAPATTGIVTTAPPVTVAPTTPVPTTVVPLP